MSSECRTFPCCLKIQNEFLWVYSYIYLNAALKKAKNDVKLELLTIPDHATKWGWAYSS